MIERILDVFVLATLGALAGAVVWLVLDFVRQARILDDPVSWPDTPGARNDRRRLLEDR